VSFFGGPRPFISDLTQTGIYVRIIGDHGYAAPDKQYGQPEDGADLDVTGVQQRTLRVQVQFVSLVETDSGASSTQAGNFSGRIWSDAVADLMLVGGLTVAEVLDAVPVTAVIDDRELETFTVDMTLNYCSELDLGTVGYVDRVTGTGELVNGGPDQSFDSDQPEGTPADVLFGCDSAGATSLSTLTPIETSTLDLVLPPVYPAGQKFYFCWLPALGGASVKLSGFGVDPLPTRTVAFRGNSYSVIETANAFTWPAGLSFVVEGTL
jgi:hypothetical protein